MKILRFLGALISAINQSADRQSDKLSARLAHHGEYKNYDDDNLLGIFGGFALFFTWCISLVIFVGVVCIYISLITYFSFGVVIPGLERIMSMSGLKISIFTASALVSIRITLFLFHYVRHAGCRLRILNCT